jgi:hypothetical protein
MALISLLSSGLIYGNQTSGHPDVFGSLSVSMDVPPRVMRCAAVPCPLFIRLQDGRNNKIKASPALRRESRGRKKE